ncbi:MAG: 23S rRNA (guanosine(2251)-2'-O)-methyltransferase RlmB [Acidobacteria bacterium]|nr:23S rRNA (guanosine(2251)-2'-O)-methyltransferase RlmB [Acidobacteriota bacterium]TDI53571.1 MAG: 23S rRNA (guanosine(2251)-2'-O)-methyltransferase RlmB [Acidobacteriota bacterium]TDI54138.1 MAG: 23S rRNA (guanosine(2251)-2'-O)-methyltransferase RlmB [Acidobacteriota bacterium]
MAPAGFGNRVEGVHAVAAAVEAGRVNRLYVERRRRERADIAALVDRVGSGKVRLIDDVRTLATTDSPQGVVADCRPISSVTLESLSAQDTALLVLDHLEDPQNVGAVARSASAAGIMGLVVSSKRAAPLSAAAFKASAGALETLPVVIVGSIPEALNRLKEFGIWIVGLDASGEQSLFGLDLLTEPVAVVIGAEGTGLSQLAAKRCDVVVSIPMVKEAESLNASVSGALAAFEIMRVRNRPG